jgi:DNA-binding HxlR family transcriptional regulator
MARDTGYGQFCPVARAAEVLTQRWTPLVVRELLCGTRRFNDLRRGVPMMSPSLLSRRLRSLEQAGLVERHSSEGGREYHLTAAGQALQPVILAMGTWGIRWLQHELTPEQLDPALLMWDMQRRVNVEALPARRAVVHFRYHDAPRGMKRWWLVLDRPEVDLCLKDPGFPVDLNVGCDLRTMVQIWLGKRPMSGALRSGELVLEGPPELRRELRRWLKLSLFAGRNASQGPVPK